MIYKITPLDTLFFRGGQPFNAGETGPLEVTGQFPPPPPTVVGAMRAALARAYDWDGKSNWSGNPVLQGVLGDGDDLGKLSFRGPYLLKNGELVFPVPLHVLGRLSPANGDGEQQMSFTCLRPGLKRLTDIGEVQLPEKVSNDVGFKALEGHWLTKAGMASVLAGGVPDAGDVLEQKCLWQTENRVGIQRDLKSKTTKDNALYQSAHVRLAKDIALAISIDGLPDGWKPQSPAPLGGESRQVWIDGIEALSFPEPKLEPVNDKIRYTATLITPAKLTGDGRRTPGGVVEGLAGQVVSACIGKPVLIGGWDSLKHEPKPLEPHLPTGSTFFMEASESEAETIRQQHGKHIGKKTNWGYGQVLIGRWSA